MLFGDGNIVHRPGPGMGILSVEALEFFVGFVQRLELLVVEIVLRVEIPPGAPKQEEGDNCADDEK